jgi:LPXTG-motif cell wall-anchored protein
MRSIGRHVWLLSAVAVGMILAGAALLGSPAAASPAPTPAPSAEGGVWVDSHGHCHRRHRPCPCPRPTPTHTMYPIPMPPPGPIAQPPQQPGSPQLPVTGPDRSMIYVAVSGGVLSVFGTGLVLLTSRRRRTRA